MGSQSTNLASNSSDLSTVTNRSSVMVLTLQQNDVPLHPFAEYFKDVAHHKYVINNDIKKTAF